MRKPVVKQNEFTQLCDRAGLTLNEAANILEVSERTAYRYASGSPSRLALRVLREAAGKTPSSTSPISFRFIDLFAGIGGLRVGFQGIGGHCVFTSEWDPNAQKTYARNFRDNHPIAGDIREYSEDPALIPEHDVLLAGFPCQPFSIAGVSKKNALGRPHGFLCDTQGTLFFDTAQIIAHHRPAAFVLENVKNLQRHDKGRTFATIMNVLENELKYHVTTRVISSEPWVPQKRERIFIVGFREPTAFDLNSLEIPAAAAGPKLGSILEPHDEVDPKYTLTPRLWEYLKAYKAKHESKGNGFGYSLFGPEDVTRTLSARYYKDGSEILVDQPGERPRRLTPLECARLMGFDRGDRRWHIPASVSDTQAYRQFGNAVVVPVVEFLAEAMKPHIESAVAKCVNRPASASVRVTRPVREPVAANG
ncbi:DNA (cytosine-5-)-methyltransferase [Govanella unica]|uniref:Cytosine-specific methyltransferase n=1 Tax=Govanella unica TaxID=2975056 RepID=A0A9X3TW30_9PROT|nr:DNA (cytosine-5-)-methyltransferase [Govania unica]MDA5192794.1 DNA (cytosine-5-)-methyltransferase [Govania unica]